MDIYVAQPEDLSSFASVYECLRTVICHCLQDDIKLMPRSCRPNFDSAEATNTDASAASMHEDDFLMDSQDQAKLISYAIQIVSLYTFFKATLTEYFVGQSTGVELGPEVIVASANAKDVRSPSRFG